MNMGCLWQAEEDSSCGASVGGEESPGVPARYFRYLTAHTTATSTWCSTRGTPSKKLATFTDDANRDQRRQPAKEIKHSLLKQNIVVCRLNF